MTFNLNLSRISEALERIAGALERAYPPPEILETRKRGPEAMIRYGDNNREWLRGELKETIHQKGLSPESEQQLLQEYLSRFDEEDLEETE